MQITYMTNQGRYKVCNDDALLIHKEILSEAEMTDPRSVSLEERPLLVATADGMGGHSYGYLAARIVLEVLLENQSNLNSVEEIQKTLLVCIEKLDKAAAKKKLIKKGMGSTVAGVVFGVDRSFVFNCGDSRVYHFSQGETRQLSQDHTVMQERIDKGLLTEEESRNHAMKSIMTDALVGGMKTEETKFHIAPFTHQPGDRILVCTDGIWGELSDSVLRKYLSGLGGMQAVSQLFKDALNNGSRDNLSAVMMEL